jgi:hypothetical protein
MHNQLFNLLYTFCSCRNSPSMRFGDIIFSKELLRSLF